MKEREGGKERIGREERVYGGGREGGDSLPKYLGNVVHRLLAFKHKPSRWL